MYSQRRTPKQTLKHFYVKGPERVDLGSSCPAAAHSFNLQRLTCWQECAIYPGSLDVLSAFKSFSNRSKLSVFGWSKIDQRGCPRNDDLP